MAELSTERKVCGTCADWRDGECYSNLYDELPDYPASPPASGVTAKPTDNQWWPTALLTDEAFGCINWREKED